MKEIELPDGNIGEFPDEMSDDQIAAVLRRQFPAPEAPAPARLGPLDKLRLMASDTIVPDLARYGAKAAGGSANFLADTAVRGANDLGLAQVPAERLPSQRYNRFMEQLMGAPQQEGGVGALANVVGTAAGMGADPFGKFTRNAQQAGMPPNPGRALTVEEQTRNAGMREGLKITPAFVPKTPAGNTLAWTSGEARLGDAFSRANRPAFDEVMKSANKLPRELSEAALTGRVQDEAARGYEPIRKVAGALTFKGKVLSPSEALDKIAELRADANRFFNAPTPQPQVGRDLKAESNALKATLGRYLERSEGRQVGRKMIADYEDARRNIAIAERTKEALISGTGSVDPQKLAAQLEAGVPWTGGPRRAAEFANAFKPVSQFPRKGEGTSIDKASLGLGASFVGLLGQTLGAPGRKFLKSPTYQNSLFAKPRSYEPPSDIATRLYAATPGQLYDLWSAPE